MWSPIEGALSPCGPRRWPRLPRKTALAKRNQIATAEGAAPRCCSPRALLPPPHRRTPGPAAAAPPPPHRRTAALPPWRFLRDSRRFCRDSLQWNVPYSGITWYPRIRNWVDPSRKVVISYSGAGLCIFLKTVQSRPSALSPYVLLCPTRLLGNVRPEPIDAHAQRICHAETPDTVRRGCNSSLGIPSSPFRLTMGRAERM